MLTLVPILNQEDKFTGIMSSNNLVTFVGTLLCICCCVSECKEDFCMLVDCRPHLCPQ